MERLHKGSVGQALEDGIPAEEVIRRFMVSKTYELLQTDAARLWAESPEYVIDMYKSELCGDIDNWLKI